MLGAPDVAGARRAVGRIVGKMTKQLGRNFALGGKHGLDVIHRDFEFSIGPVAEQEPARPLAWEEYGGGLPVFPTAADPDAA